MSQHFLIPTQNEWDQLSKIYRRLNLQLGVTEESYLTKDNIFAFSRPIFNEKKTFHIPNINDDYIKHSRLVIYMANDFWLHTPRPWLNIARNTEKNFELLLDELSVYEQVSPVFGVNKKSDFNRSSLTRLLKKIEDEKIIESCTLKEWFEKYPGNNKISKDHERTSAKIFPMTAIGTLFYEYIINAPSMFQPYLSSYFENIVFGAEKSSSNILEKTQNRYNVSTTPLVNLGIALRKERLSLFWDSPFHYQDMKKKYVFHEYHEEIMSEQKKILGSDYDFFIHAHNPATKILREWEALSYFEEIMGLSKYQGIKNIKEISGEMILDLFSEKIAWDKVILLQLWNKLFKKKVKFNEKFLPDEPI